VGIRHPHDRCVPVAAPRKAICLDAGTYLMDVETAHAEAAPVAGHSAKLLHFDEPDASERESCASLLCNACGWLRDEGGREATPTAEARAGAEADAADAVMVADVESADRHPERTAGRTRPGECCFEAEMAHPPQLASTQHETPAATTTTQRARQPPVRAHSRANMRMSVKSFMDALLEFTRPSRGQPSRLPPAQQTTKHKTDIHRKRCPKDPPRMPSHGSPAEAPATNSGHTPAT
jgi:hypothetical protein